MALTFLSLVMLGLLGAMIAPAPRQQPVAVRVRSRR